MMFGDLVYSLRDDYAQGRSDICVTVNDVVPSGLKTVGKNRRSKFIQSVENPILNLEL
eukprot:gnl/Chilomastix_caulleri/6808.p1 GENE.gnl/Chilomastix_caulleri/6808~~gnl/Chilomastix_caulleri/6808.p1  ORF type:complete len:58 (+),score=4.51 gnl/Chilomastix_caulleri/6808:172-345(+)